MLVCTAHDIQDCLVYLLCHPVTAGDIYEIKIIFFLFKCIIVQLCILFMKGHINAFVAIICVLQERKLHEATCVIESLRKSTLELQIQNESLSLKLQEELANREEIKQK